MKKNIEITGTLKMESQKNIVVDLFSNGGKIDWFELNYKHKSINVELSDNIGKILKVDVNDYFDYIKLLDELGLEIPKSYRRHWTPKTGERYFYIDSQGEVYPNYIANFGYNEVDQKRYENYNAFPTMELAEKAVNLSKLGRLILLWQYANDCLFEPVWNNKRSRKHYFYYSHNLERILVGDYFDFQDDILYFETEEQTKAFVDMYSEEIKKIMGVI